MVSTQARGQCMLKRHVAQQVLLGASRHGMQSLSQEAVMGVSASPWRARSAGSAAWVRAGTPLWPAAMGGGAGVCVHGRRCSSPAAGWALASVRSSDDADMTSPYAAGLWAGTLLGVRRRSRRCVCLQTRGCWSCTRLHDSFLYACQMLTSLLLNRHAAGGCRGGARAGVCLQGRRCGHGAPG